jgi:hypothetical protein
VVVVRSARRAWLALQRTFAPPVPALRLGAFRAIVCLIAIYDVMLWSHAVFVDAAEVSAGGASRPWTPIYLMQVLGARPLNLEEARLLFWVALTALGCGALGLMSRLSCAVAAIAFYWWSGLAYSFGKPHHDKVALALTLASLPFARTGAALSLDALWRRRRLRPQVAAHYVRGTPIRVAQVTLAIGYCGAGLSKLLLGGLTWFNGYTLQGIMLGHDGYLSRVVGQSPWLCQIQSVGVVAVQVLFPLVLFWPRLRWFFLPAAMGFHLMTWLTMDTGPYMRVWLMLFAFVSLERVPAALHRWLRSGGAPAIATVVGCGGLAALVGYVAAHVIPVGWLVALAMVLLAGFWWHVASALRLASRSASRSAGSMDEGS